MKVVANKKIYKVKNLLYNMGRTKDLVEYFNSEYGKYFYGDRNDDFVSHGNSKFTNTIPHGEEHGNSGALKNFSEYIIQSPTSIKKFDLNPSSEQEPSSEQMSDMERMNFLIKTYDAGNK